jgi:hypothetical protein
MRWQLPANMPQPHMQTTRNRGSPGSVAISVNPVCEVIICLLAALGNIAAPNIFIGAGTA